MLRAKRRWSPASLIAQLVGGDVLDDLVDDDGLRGAIDLEDDGLGVGVGRVGARLAEAEGPELVAHRRGDGAHGGPGHPSAGGEGSEGEEVAVCQTLKDPNFAPFIQQNQSGRKQLRQEIHFFVNRYKSMSILRGVGEGGTYRIVSRWCLGEPFPFSRIQKDKTFVFERFYRNSEPL